MSLETTARSAGLSYQDVIQIVESNVLDSNSQIYRALASDVASMVAYREKKDSVGGKTNKRKVYIPYTVDPSLVYMLAGAYPEWDVVFTSSERVSSPRARAIFDLTLEKLYSFASGKHMTVCVYGATINSIVLRNRFWAHVCCPLELSSMNVAAMKDHRSLVAITKKCAQAGYELPMAKRYEEMDVGELACADPVHCTYQADLGVMMLHKTNTCFKQVCIYMSRHNIQVCFFAVPWCANLELNREGPFEELDAYVKPVGEYIDLVYNNAQDLDQRYYYQAYLSLITDTRCDVGEIAYLKEHVDLNNGMAIFRVGASKKAFSDPPPVYRSWLTPRYRALYSVRAVVPKSNHVNLSRADAYKIEQFDVPKEQLDRLLNHAMSINTQDFTVATVKRKLRSLSSTYVVNSTVTRPSERVSTEHFNALAMVVFTDCFMRKYATGITVAKLAGDTREIIALNEKGFLRVAPVLLMRLLYSAYNDTIGVLQDKLRRAWFGLKDNIPQGTISDAVGYKTYTTKQSNPWFGTGTYGGGKISSRHFSLYLPGCAELSFLRSTGILGEANPDLLEYMTPSDRAQLRADLSEAMQGSEATDEETLFSSTAVPPRAVVDDDSVRSLALKVSTQNEGSVRLNEFALEQLHPLVERHPPEIIHAGKSDNIIGDLEHALSVFFPGSTIMDTGQYQSDINYGPLELVIRAVRLKLDISKLQPLRPERIFHPKVRAHTAPHSKNTMPNTLYTVTKRNLNTADSSVPAGIRETFNRVWAAMLKVYYIPGAESKLASMPYIGLTREHVAEWASRIPEEARDKLANDHDFYKEELDLAYNDMMLKGKGKSILDKSFSEVVKPSQSIQYDPTKVRVAIYSPLIGQKVDRESSILKSNVLIMQRKNPDQINEFLCRFDWRPKKGIKRTYLEFDFSMFDKCQGMMACSMHWLKCEKFGMLPDYLKILEDGNFVRVATSIKAGVRMTIPLERGSGDPDTLDGNSDVSMAVLSWFFLRYLDAIEYIMIMGDDVTVALRGEVDLSTVEEQVLNIFNLTVKYTLSEYGYFCSGWIAHLDNGLSRWVSDPPKRLLDYCNMSHNEETPVHDQYISHHDLVKGIEDFGVQQYLAKAVPYRYREVNPDIPGETVIEACKVIATVKDDEDLFKSLRYDTTQVRYL